MDGPIYQKYLVFVRSPMWEVGEDMFFRDFFRIVGATDVEKIVGSGNSDETVPSIYVFNSIYSGHGMWKLVKEQRGWESDKDYVLYDRTGQFFPIGPVIIGGRT